jgi:hypothetical protein
MSTIFPMLGYFTKQLFSSFGKNLEKNHNFGIFSIALFSRRCDNYSIRYRNSCGGLEDSIAGSNKRLPQSDFQRRGAYFLDKGYGVKKSEKAKARDKVIEASRRAYEKQTAATVASNRRSAKRTSTVLTAAKNKKGN